MHAAQQDSSARRTSNPATSAYAQFNAVIGLHVDPAVINAIVTHEGQAAVRAAVDGKDQNQLKRMLCLYATRETVLKLRVDTLKPAQVAQAIANVGWATYAQTLADPAPGACAKLAQWTSAALLDGGDPEPTASAPAQAPLAPHANQPANPDLPPPARLAPPGAVRGPRPAPTSHRPPPAGAVVQRPQAHAEERSRRPVDACQLAPPSASEMAEAAANAAFEEQFDAPAEGDRKPTRPGEERLPNEHVYNKGKDPKSGALVARAALCLEAVTDRNKNPVVKFEGAGPHPTNPERYNWADKIIFYATPDELPKLLCVMLGYLEEAAFFNHGENNDKSLKLKRQADSLYCTLSEGREKSVAVKIPAANASRIAVLTMLQYQRASHGLDASALHMVLARVVAPMVTGEKGKRQ